MTYGLVNATAVEGRHGSFCCAWIVVFDKTVIKAFALCESQDQYHRPSKASIGGRVNGGVNKVEVEA